MAEHPFYTARDPESGTPLLEYLGKYLPYQENWSHRFAVREDGTPRTIAAAEGRVEIDCCPLHLEYRFDGKPVYRPCLTWEQTAREGGDGFFLLLPITAASYSRFPDVAREIQSRLDGFPIPREDLEFVARCLAGHVCRLRTNGETAETAAPEEQLPLALSMEGGGKLYTAEWFEDAGGVTIYRQTFSGRRIQERLLPDPEGNWAAAPGPEESARRSGVVPTVSFTADSGLAAAWRRLAELTDPRFFDLSRLRELPWHVYYTTASGTEWSLIREDLRRDEPKQDAWALLAQWGIEEVPPDLEEAASRLQQAIREAAPEEPEEKPPTEPPVTPEALSALLYSFSQGEVDRLEMEWSPGRLVLRRDGEKYACLYFENSYGRGEHWYARLADPEMYRTIDCGDVAYIPFGMGKLAEYSVFHSAQDLLRDIDQVLGQMGYDQIQEGGTGGWLWSGEVYRQDAKHKVLIMQQKLGGVPQTRGRNYAFSKFVLSRPAAELETVDPGGERTVTPLRSGTYGLAADGLVQFMMGKLASIRVSWSFQTAEGGTERKHLVLLQDRGKYMLLWLEDGNRQALAYASDEPRWFLGHAVPACLVHEDLKRLRNGIDLLLDDIDNTEPVLSQPGQFAEVRTDYEELRTALVHET